MIYTRELLRKSPTLDYAVQLMDRLGCTLSFGDPGVGRASYNQDTNKITMNLDEIPGIADRCSVLAHEVTHARQRSLLPAHVYLSLGEEGFIEVMMKAEIEAFTQQLLCLRELQPWYGTEECYKEWGRRLSGASLESFIRTGFGNFYHSHYSLVYQGNCDNLLKGREFIWTCIKE